MKNMTKKAVILVTAIFALILGAFTFVDTLYTILEPNVRIYTVPDYNGGYSNISYTDPNAIPVYILMFLLVAVIVTLGALLCKFQTQKAILITLLILFATSVFMIPICLVPLQKYGSVFVGFEVMFSLAGTVLSIVGLCMADDPPPRPDFPPPPPPGFFPPPPPNGRGSFPPPPPGAFPPPPNGNGRFNPPPPNGQGQFPPPNAPSAPPALSEREKRIEEIKQKRKSGEITEDEYRDMLLKEIEKA